MRCASVLAEESTGASASLATSRTRTMRSLRTSLLGDPMTEHATSTNGNNDGPRPLSYRERLGEFVRFPPSVSHGAEWPLSPEPYPRRDLNPPAGTFFVHALACDFSAAQGPGNAGLDGARRQVGHWALYALLVLVPVTAILGAWLEGHPLTVLAVGDLQPWLPPSRLFGLVLAGIHGWLGDMLIWLGGLHAAAALYHHFWRRDSVLLSMLPGR
jgi:cytochrome b561-like protein